MVAEPAGDRQLVAGVPFEAFIADASLRLQRTLVGRYGTDLGVDAAAEALAWAWEHRNKLVGMKNPIGYLYRVGQTAVRGQTRRRRPVTLPVERPVDEFELPDPGLHEALQKLKTDQRIAVMLVHGYAYPYAEAAAMMDVPISTLKNHLNRGLRKLRHHLESGSR